MCGLSIAPVSRDPITDTPGSVVTGHQGLGEVKRAWIGIDSATASGRVEFNSDLLQVPFTVSGGIYSTANAPRWRCMIDLTAPQPYTFISAQVHIQHGAIAA